MKFKHLFTSGVSPKKKDIVFGTINMFYKGDRYLPANLQISQLPMYFIAEIEDINEEIEELKLTKLIYFAEIPKEKKYLQKHPQENPYRVVPYFPKVSEVFQNWEFSFVVNPEEIETIFVIKRKEKVYFESEGLIQLWETLGKKLIGEESLEVPSAQEKEILKEIVNKPKVN